MTAARATPIAAATAVIVFAKLPTPGQAKTRLAPALGLIGAAVLAQRMLEHAVDAACGAGFGTVELCATPHTDAPILANLVERHGITLRAQGEGDLGERMERALTRCLKTHPRVLLMGADIPALDAPLLRQAAAALDRHDAVFIPAHDGGYALVGLRRSAPELFTRIAWSTPTVMAATRERARSAGIGFAELAPVFDIDEPSDLIHVPEHMLDGLEALGDNGTRDATRAS